MEKNNETLHVLRHSCSHIMAQAVQKLFPQAKLAIGPATDNGFYYDFDLTDGYAFTHDDLVKIEEEMKNIIKQNLTFEKYVIPDVDKQIAEFKAEGEIYKAELLEEHRNDNPTLYLTKDKDGNVLGYVITVTAKDGSQGNITFSVGIKNDGTVNGYSITSMSETPGLGDKAKTEDFSKQYKNKNVDSFNVVKQAPSADNEIEAISGATITSKAMTNGVNACITYFQNELEGGAE